MCAAVPYASDHFRSLGDRDPPYPPPSCRRKQLSLEYPVRGTDRATNPVSMTISLTAAKIVQLKGLVLEWPSNRHFGKGVTFGFKRCVDLFVRSHVWVQTLSGPFCERESRCSSIICEI